MREHPFVKDTINERRGDLVGVKKLVEDILDKKLEEAEKRIMKNMEELFMRFSPIMGKACSNSVISSVPEGKEEEPEDEDDIGEDITDEDEDEKEEEEKPFNLDSFNESVKEMEEQYPESDTEEEKEEEKAEELPDEDIKDIKDESKGKDVKDEPKDEECCYEEEYYPPEYGKKHWVKLGLTQKECYYTFKKGSISVALKDGETRKKIGIVTWLKVKKGMGMANHIESNWSKGKLVRSEDGDAYLAYDDDDYHKPPHMKRRVELFIVDKDKAEEFGEISKEWKDNPCYCMLNFKMSGRYFDFKNWCSNWLKEKGNDMGYCEDYDKLIEYMEV